MHKERREICKEFNGVQDVKNALNHDTVKVFQSKDDDDEVVQNGKITDNRKHPNW